MNRKQKNILLAGIGLTVLAGLFPPWRFVLDTAQFRDSRPAGHAWSAPDFVKTSENKMLNNYPHLVQTRIDLEALAVEWIMIVLVVCGLLLIFKERKSS